MHRAVRLTMVIITLALTTAATMAAASPAHEYAHCILGWLEWNGGPCHVTFYMPLNLPRYLGETYEFGSPLDHLIIIPAQLLITSAISLANAILFVKIAWGRDLL